MKELVFLMSFATFMIVVGGFLVAYCADRLRHIQDSVLRIEDMMRRKL